MSKDEDTNTESNVSPQVENGYMRIANEIWEAINMAQLTVSERKAMDMVLRLSYGCGKKWCKIEKWSDMLAVGISKSHAKETLEKLKEKKILKFEFRSKISFNKHYDQWTVSWKGDKARYAELVRLNLISSHTVTSEMEKFPHGNLKVPTREPKSSHTGTSTAPTATNNNDSQPPKDILKDKEKTTTTRGGGFSASPEDEELPVRTIANDVTELQGACLTKWRGLLTLPPPDSHCRRALEEFPIDTLSEAVSRCPDIPNPPITADKAINLVLKAARNPDWWKPKESRVEPVTKSQLDKDTASAINMVRAYTQSTDVEIGVNALSGLRRFFDTYGHEFGAEIGMEYTQFTEICGE